jgi:hypothetical protein
MTAPLEASWLGNGKIQLRAVAIIVIVVTTFTGDR